MVRNGEPIPYPYIASMQYLAIGSTVLIDATFHCGLHSIGQTGRVWLGIWLDLLVINFDPRFME